jgi:hypothetical protein
MLQTTTEDAKFVVATDLYVKEQIYPATGSAPYLKEQLCQMQEQLHI